MDGNQQFDQEGWVILTPTQVNRMVAEQCGYTRIKNWKSHGLLGLHPDVPEQDRNFPISANGEKVTWGSKIPDFWEDLNACHWMERYLARVGYEHDLYNNHMSDDREWEIKDDFDLFHQGGWIWHANSHQKCIAFLLVKLRNWQFRLIHGIPHISRDNVPQMNHYFDFDD